MKLKIALKKAKNRIEKIKASNTWQKIFVHRIDEEKLRQYKDQHRLMGGIDMRGF